MAIADHHRVPGANENPVTSATSAPFNVAAQRICHLYGSFGSKKIPTPSKAPSTTPIRITIRKFIARSCDLTRPSSATAGGGEHGKLGELFHTIKRAHHGFRPIRWVRFSLG